MKIIIGIILALAGVIALAIVFPPILILYAILIGIALMSN